MKIRFFRVALLVSEIFSWELDVKITKQIIELQKRELEKRGYRFDDEWYVTFLNK